MPTLEIGELVEATGGELIQGDPSTTVQSYTIDSRNARAGTVFFALPGTRSDGHAFLGKAAAAGATAAVVHRDVTGNGPLPPNVIRTRDTTEALGRCGARARRSLGGTTFIGLTGSTGKTTTKELMAAGIAPSKRVHKTRGNLNNHLGVPLTLLACPDDAELAVIEMGMNAPGEIAALNRMVRPHIGLVTNVRPAHVEAFVDLDDVGAAKGELFATLDDDAISVVNLDDPHVRVQSMRHAGPRVTFGKDVHADVRQGHVDNRFLPGAGLQFFVGDTARKLDLKLGGAHAAHDALAALAAIHAAGLDLDAAVEAMAKVEPGPGRGRVIHLDGDVVVIDDTYNSSPAALEAVLSTLRQTECRGRKILVMGDMLELGGAARYFHREAGKRAAAAGVKLMIGVGAHTRASLEAARRGGVPEVHHDADVHGAARFLARRLAEGDLVVVKGSRGVGLERVVQALMQRRETD